MCDRPIAEDAFMPLYCPDTYKAQRMCDEVVDDCLEALEFVFDWFVTDKMLEKLNNALRANDDILFYNEDFNKVTFIACQIHILAADFDRIELDNDNNFCENDSDTIIHVRLLAWRSNFNKRKAF